jgi:hypothetical protein
LVNEAEGELVVYPTVLNPGQPLTISNSIKGNLTFNLFDGLGRKVFLKYLDNSVTKEKISLPIDLPKGIYIYKVIGENSKLTTGKITLTN